MSGHNSVIGKVIVAFWVVRISKPEWIISHYYPSVGFLKVIPTFFLAGFLLYVILGPRNIKYDKPLLFFLVATAISTVFASNRGMALLIFRGMTETFIVSATMLTFLDSDEDVRKLLKVYLLAFILFGVWGIAEKGRIRAFLPLEDEDSFGPFMTLGIPFSYYLRPIYAKQKGGRYCFVALVISAAGAVVSFARGTFVSLVMVAGYMFLRSKNRARFVIGSLLVTLACFIIAGLGSDRFYMRYKAEVSSIWEQGTEEHTARNRIYLWTKAMLMFADHPLVGVGPGCYGFRLVRYYRFQEWGEYGVSPIQSFGRATHNIYLQVLAEMGLVGIVALVVLVFSFFKKTFAMKRLASLKVPENRLEEGRYDETQHSIRLYYYSLAMEAGMIGFLVNSFFFNLLFYSWFWDLIILNSLIYQQASKVNLEAA